MTDDDPDIASQARLVADLAATGILSIGEATRVVANLTGLAARAEMAEAEVRHLRAVAEWAKDAPHHHGCMWRKRPKIDPYTRRCTCGRDQVMRDAAATREMPR